MRRLKSLGSYWLVLNLLLLNFSILGQCPNALFDSESTVCLGTSTTFSNSSLNSVSYVWDFDAGDLSQTPEAANLTTFSALNTATNLEVAFDSSSDNWYGFASSRGSNLIYRLDFGTDLQSVPNLNQLTIANLSTPEGFKMFSEGGEWYALVHNAGSSTLSRIDFGSSLESDNLTANPLVTVGALNSTLDLIQSADSLVAVVTNFSTNTISFVPFGNSIQNNPAQVDVFTTSAISGASGLIGVEIFFDCGDWYGVANGFSSLTSHFLEFGSDLFTNPTVTEIANNGLLTGNPLRSEVRREGGKYIAIVSTRDGSVYRYDLGEDNLVQIEATESLGNLGVLDRLHAFTLVEDSSKWYAFAINTSTDAFYSIEFPSVLDSNPKSNDANPTFTFDQLGTFTVQLSAIDASGQISFTTEEITVNELPTGDFSVSDGCVDTDYTFTGISTEAITSWSWDFGDGNSDVGQIVNHNYAFSGNYQVELTISDGTCESTIVQQLDVYDTPPAPTFDVSATSFCANSEITFTNTTDDASYSGPLTYEWGFNGEGSATTKDTTFAFSTSGSKTITLKSIVDDCEVSEMEVIVLQVGSVADYSYTNNCFGEAIQFTDQSTGTITDYFWDFGDGNTSTDQSPTHQFLVAGTYSVSLSIINSDGCESSVENDIVYSDGPLASFSASEATENIPVSLNATDLTGADDFITSWDWDFDGLGSSDQQSVEFTFPNVQNYTVTLTVQTNQGCEFQVDQSIAVMQSACPSIDFTIPSEVCIGERLEIINQSVNAESYEWSFCSQDLSSAPQISDLDSAGLFSSAFGMDLIEESGVNYLFASSSGVDQVNRLTYSDDFGSEATITTLGALVTNPSGIKLFKTANTWYGILLSTNGSISKLTFGDITNESPLVETIDGLTMINNARGLSIVQDSDFIYVLVAGSGQLQVLRFNSSFDGVPDELVSSITGASFSNSISMYNDCGSWYGLIGTSTSNAYHVEFDMGLFVEPVFTSIPGSPNSGGSSIINQGEDYYGVITNAETNGFTILDFGGSLSNTNPSITSFNSFETNGVIVGLEFIRNNGNYAGIAMDLSGDLYMIDFDEPCDFSSVEFQPNDISYEATGTYDVVLYGSNSDGVEVSVAKQIIVNASTASDIDFSVDDSRCILNESSFTSVNTSGDIQSYSWDFGDGNTSNQASPLHQYVTSGTYTVKLEVSNIDGCTNSISKELTYYDDAPTPSYVVSGSNCSASTLSFTNTTDISGYSDEDVSYSWDFNGEGVSLERSPEFTFTTAGSKTVILSVAIPGCINEIEQVFVLEAGAETAFLYTNNCFGELVQFTNATVGDVAAYQWDFGDGTQSSDENPTHEFLLAGIYTVSLTSTSTNGCESVSTQEIIVNNQALASFTTGVLEENVPVQFTATDETSSGDAIDTWLWDFGGLGSSSDQNPLFAFPLPGDYLITLDITTTQGCTYQIAEIITIELAECPTLDYSITANVCLGEILEITNGSLNADRYEWDFCVQDLANSSTTSVVELQAIGGVTNGFGLDVVSSNGMEHLFVTSSGGGDEIYRVDLGEGFAKPGSVVLLGSVVVNPTGIKLKEEGGVWYGLLLTQEGLLYRLTLDAGIADNTVEIEQIVGATQSLSNARGVTIVEEGGTTYAALSGGNSLQVIRFPSGIGSSPDAELVTSITGANFSSSVPLYNECGSWYGILSSASGGTYHLSFPSGLLQTPVSTLIAGAPNSGGASIVYSNGNYYGFLTNTSNPGLVRLDFGSSLSNTVPLVEDMGSFDVVGSSTGLELFHRSREYAGLGMNLDGSVYRIDFESPCSIFSGELEPTNISYSVAGTYDVALYGTGANGGEESLTKQVFVNSSVAPDVGIASSNFCITNSNTFTPSLTGLTSYSWDFDGDGMEDSNLESPTYQYSASGTYTVRLDVTDGTCGNFTEQEITIYPDPPIPTFTASNLVCINTDVSFTNTTNETGFDGALEYLWDFNGEGSSIERDPSFTFTTAGTKEVTVTSSIPGCEAISEIFEIEVSAGPTADFNPSSFGICEGEFITFADGSTNGATSWSWDFGDGFTSTAQNPDHLFTTAGNYTVALTVADDLGCQSTITEEVSIAALPTVSFDFDVICTSSEGIQFMDLSTVEGADIVSRTWFVDAAEAATEENPILSFEDAGSVNIRLEVTSSNGCTSSYSEDVQILPSPSPDFSISVGCEGEASSFIDLTASAGNPIGTWLWSVDGITYNTQNISHTFSGTGIFDVTLEVTGQNFCSETITQTVEILQLPDVGFSIDGDCSNEFITLSDTSIVFQDPVVSRSWYLDGAVVGNGSELLLEALPQSTYDLALEVTTESGCVTSSNQELLINSTPNASFEFQRDFGVPGDQITFSNESSGAVSHQWFFNGSPAGSESNEKVISFPDAGTYEISLVSTNSLGCSDTTSTEVLIAVPIVDLSIGQFEVVTNANSGQIFVEIQNNGNLPVEVTEAVIELENQFSVTEQIASLVGIGESKLVSLNTGIPLNTSELSYLCVTLNSQYEGYPDLTPVNNEKCISIQPTAIVVEAPYPNPARTETRVKLIAPMEGSAAISLFNSSGKIEFSYTENVEAGLNNFFLNIGDLEAGIYFVRLQINETISVQRIIKL